MKDTFLKNPLIKSALIIPALGLFVLGGAVTQSAFADTTSDTTATRGAHPPANAGFQHAELTEEQKTALEKAHTLRESGDIDGAKAVLEAAGIPFPLHFFGDDRPELTDEQRATLDQAKALRDSGDEAGAKALLESAGIAPRMFGHGPRNEWMKSLTDAQKTALKQAKTLRESGDIDGAKAVLEAAGIPVPPVHPDRGQNGDLGT